MSHADAGLEATDKLRPELVRRLPLEIRLHILTFVLLQPAVIPMEPSLEAGFPQETHGPFIDIDTETLRRCNNKIRRWRVIYLITTRRRPNGQRPINHVLRFNPKFDIAEIMDFRLPEIYVDVPKDGTAPSYNFPFQRIISRNLGFGHTYMDQENTKRRWHSCWRRAYSGVGVDQPLELFQLEDLREVTFTYARVDNSLLVPWPAPSRSMSRYGEFECCRRPNGSIAAIWFRNLDRDDLAEMLDTSRMSWKGWSSTYRLLAVATPTAEPDMAMRLRITGTDDGHIMTTTRCNREGWTLLEDARRGETVRMAKLRTH
ncbi:hypothetical protein QQZ08_011549 [Neonectria magnoliae]|uniref:F-box domain-containing protein n=1 Tax=Neonectria magnoliae TaxID=2732573 RepID=A0ABR1H9V7_9HYPO